MCRCITISGAVEVRRPAIPRVSRTPDLGVANPARPMLQLSEDGSSLTVVSGTWGKTCWVIVTSPSST